MVVESGREGRHTVLGEAFQNAPDDELLVTDDRVACQVRAYAALTLWAVANGAVTGEQKPTRSKHLVENGRIDVNDLLGLLVDDSGAGNRDEVELPTKGLTPYVPRLPVACEGVEGPSGVRDLQRSIRSLDGADQVSRRTFRH